MWVTCTSTKRGRVHTNLAARLIARWECWKGAIRRSLKKGKRKMAATKWTINIRLRTELRGRGYRLNLIMAKGRKSAGKGFESFPLPFFPFPINNCSKLTSFGNFWSFSEHVCGAHKKHKHAFVFVLFFVLF